MMKQILVPTDFSPTSERAFRFAINVALKVKCSITLYHVYIPEEVVLSEAHQNRKEYQKKMEENVRKRLQRLKKKVMPSESHVEVSIAIGHTSIISNILRFAKDNQVDLIVMGTQGATGLEKIVVGSVASQIIEKSKIPVILIPEKFELKNPEEIVFASDYHPKDRQALSFTLEIAEAYNANVTVVHLDNPTSNAEQKDFYTYAFGLQRTFADSKLNFKEIKTGNVKDTLQNLDSEIPFDMLVMVRRKKTFLEKKFLKNFSKNMACITTKPLLIVPAEE